MEYENRDEWIIKKYQQDENTMIQLFVQWCANHQLNPMALYQKAYPYQEKNAALLTAIEEANAETADIEISNETMLEVLQLFGNDDLAFVVVEEMERMPKK
jgi:antitoxin component of RelBE/YafQ-DinJ toxin-antitoxin module